MCVITVDVAICDSTYPNIELPDGCLKVYPYTYSESVCEQAENSLGSCGKVEMQKRQDKEGSQIEKRICEACAAWAALMRGRDGRMTRRSLRRADSLRSDSGSEYSVAIMTPSDSDELSESEVDARSTASGDFTEA
ncbi:hypothetical protein KVR01_006160 [Diaporthe batatas]|uniref:uncharacterized protein n=1 Tax=Diaporthe batatas TaxID=748121 RepID=UPI001D037E5B|nr:uncharacterized protein KVR01_006160 [Diaporthe batatas]KAG8164242.1 hypothetical protein KVR01_006160 [Diaporthe batatas]